MRFADNRLMHRLRRGSSPVLAVLAAFSICVPAFAATLYVSSAEDINRVISRARPGDTIEMRNGTWTDKDIQFAVDGTAGSPITLRAETPGRVILNGSSKLHISGTYLIVSGLRFESGALREGERIVEFRGSNGYATNSRLTNSAIIDYDPADASTLYHWVVLYGQDNRVDRNFFKGQNHPGVTVFSNHSQRLTAGHRIDRNHFVDRPAGSTNGYETVRLGSGNEAFLAAEVLVFLNLFERVNGEIEVVSNKSSDSDISYNTFRNTEGTITLRSGSGNRVIGNFFLGENNSRTGGVRIIGANQTITNNYFQDIGDRDGGVISIRRGGEAANGALYELVENALIANNTIVNPRRAALQMNSGGTSGLARNVVITNNLFRGSHDLFAGTEGPGWTWEGNVAHGPVGVYPSQGITVVDSSGEMEQRIRMARLNVATDERLPGLDLMGEPLSASDVGPSWLHRRTVDHDGSGYDAIVIEAENFTALTDPNNDSDTWSVVNVSSASGSRALKAPSGGYDQQDAIAEYDVAFHDPGEYNLFLRLRGLDSGSNSLFYPEDFGQMPSVVESTTVDGSWEWVRVGSFTVSSAEVNEPLRVRVGKREQGTELDMLILSPNRNLPDPLR